MASGGNTTSSADSTSATGEAAEMLKHFWPKVTEEIRNMKSEDFKSQELPLARIKKIMKLDEDVKMISAEAPALFAKAAEIFISELSLRAWSHTEDNKRRTQQRNDIAMAISKYDQFDFLIDIVPREELKPVKREEFGRAAVGADQVQYYFQLAQQHSAALQQQGQGNTAPNSAQAIQIQGGQIIQPMQVQVATGGAISLSQPNGTQPQVIHLQTTTSPKNQNITPSQPQVVQQVVGPGGEITHVPVQLTPQQIQMLTQQLQGQQPGQPVVIHTGIPVQATNGQQTFNSQQLFQIQEGTSEETYTIEENDESEQDTD